ncbi:MAG TPA: VOC family protein [Anaeromyxobacter sp.]|nr:VOC family protein [Anaeromyxobacter sp.]
MATRKGTFVWYDHLTRDVGAAIAFYSEVVGWKAEPFGDSGYQMWVGSQGPLGGVMKVTDNSGQGGHPHWMAHLQVDDVDAAAALVKKRGGKICHAPTDIPTVGRFAVIADPQGASLSLYRPNQNNMPPHDLGADGEFCWNELLTSDSAAAFRFYSELAGWKILEEMDMGPMGTYRVFGLGDTRLGGMMTTSKGAPTPPMWLCYASTHDLDAAMGRAVGKGARVTNGPVDIPGGGRVAQLTDPQGAAFALHQAPRG